MLVNTLNGLDDFNVYGELFANVKSMQNIGHPQEVQEQMIKRFVRNSFDLSGKKYISDYLDYIYKIRKYKDLDFNQGFNIGFKLLSPHLNRKEGATIIDYINSNDIYKILLYRENKVKQVLSAKTNKKEDKVHIDSAMYFCTRVKHFMKEEKKLFNTFANGKFKEISYEKLTGEEDATELDMLWLWKFLGITKERMMHVPLRKYRPKSVQDNISNFGTLASHIKNKEPEMLKWLQ
jgi:hypothetical protein